MWYIVALNPSGSLQVHAVAFETPRSAEMCVACCGCQSIFVHMLHSVASLFVDSRFHLF